MSADMMKVVNSLKAQIAALEAMITGVTEGPKKRGRPAKPQEDKPKKEMSAGMKAWHEFNARIDGLLKAAETPFKRVAEAKQFASKLKKEKAVADWTDQEILDAYTVWVDEHKPVCPVCHEDATAAPAAHGECVKTYATDFQAAGKGTKQEALADWSKVCGLTKTIAERQAEESPAPKKAGRPKMTDEQKAAKKAAKEKPVEKPIKAPKPKVAWGAATAVEEILDDEDDTVVTVVQ